MPLNLCNVTGTVKDSEGAALASLAISFVRTGTVASQGTSPDKIAEVPKVFTVTTDGSGGVDFDAHPGSYTGTVVRQNASDLTFEMAVPDAASADIADIIDSVSALTSTILQEATGARDAAETALDEFTDLYLGAKASDPATDNDGDALQTGAIYWNSADDELRVWDGVAWQAVALLPQGLGPSDSPVFAGLTLNETLQANVVSASRTGRPVFGEVITSDAGVSDNDVLLLLGDSTANRSHASGRVDLIRGSATSYGGATLKFMLQRDSGTDAASFWCTYHGVASRDVSLVTCTFGGNTRYAIRLNALGAGSAVSEGAFTGMYYCASDLEMRLVPAGDVTGITALSQASGYEPVSEFLQPLRLPAYTVATLPSASNFDRCMIWVSDETGGATMAISDGTNWRRMADAAVVS